MSNLEAFNVPPIAKKLGQISEVMSDGYHFIKMRTLVEDWQDRADAGDATAVQAIQMIEQFHRLCMVVKQ